MTTSGLKRLFWVTGIVLFAVGLVGWTDRLVSGHLNANYGSVVPWGLWVAAYIYFIGLSAGSFLISSLVYVFGMKRFERVGRLAVFTAVVTLFLALLSIWADIGHMGRAWHVLAYANFKSPMAWRSGCTRRISRCCSSSCGSSTATTSWSAGRRRGFAAPPIAR